MDAFVQLLTEWGYWGMFVAAFLAGSVLPFSSETVLVACIGLGLDPVSATLWATAGNVLGGLTCYWMGHLGKLDWIERYFKVKHEQIEKASRFVRGRGAWIAFFGFVPLMGSAILIVLGLMRSRAWAVALFMAIGKFLRYAVLVAAMQGIIHSF